MISVSDSPFHSVPPPRFQTCFVSRSRSNAINIIIIRYYYYYILFLLLLLFDTLLRNEKRSRLMEYLDSGTLVERGYKQFSGNVHVMKAVASDMVLTFCSRNPDNQLYSLLLSREHILQKSDKRGVHNLLGRRGLKIVNIRETCMNNAAWRRGSFDLIGWLALMGVLSSVFFGSW